MTRVHKGWGTWLCVGAVGNKQLLCPGPTGPSPPPLVRVPSNKVEVDREPVPRLSVAMSSGPIWCDRNPLLACSLVFFPSTFIHPSVMEPSTLHVSCLPTSRNDIVGGGSSTSCSGRVCACACTESRLPTSPLFFIASWDTGACRHHLFGRRRSYVVGSVCHCPRVLKGRSHAKHISYASLAAVVLI